MVVTRSKAKYKRSKPKKTRTIRKRYVPEMYSGELTGVIGGQQSEPTEIPMKWEAPPIEYAIQEPVVSGVSGRHVGRMGNVGCGNTAGIEFIQFGEPVTDYDIQYHLEPEHQYRGVPNINIPFFDVGYNLPFDTPPGGLRNVIKRVKASSKYKKDRRDFAYKHQLMIDSEVEERYWTKDGMYYIDVNIYDDIERKNALIALYDYRRRQSVNQASPSLYKHKQGLKSKNKNIFSKFNPDALNRLTGANPGVKIVNTPRGMEAILSGQASRYMSDVDYVNYGGKKIRVRKPKRNIVSDSHPLSYFINNERVVKITPKRKSQSKKKTVSKSTSSRK